MQLIKKLTWTDKLTMYNAKLDNQHKNIFMLINEIIHMERLYPKSEQFAIILSKISDYGLEHFKTEERYMFDMGYPNIEKHKKEHMDYIYKVAMFNTNFKQPNHTEPAEVINFLREWWYGHILHTDKDFSNFINESLINESTTKSS